MNAVSEDVEKLVGKELASANEQFPAFASEHEAWAVMHEELDECREVFELLTRQDGLLWECVKGNRGYADGLVKEMRVAAEMLACEAVQVAAMAQKYRDKLEEEEEDE